MPFFLNSQPFCLFAVRLLGNISPSLSYFFDPMPPILSLNHPLVVPANTYLYFLQLYLPVVVSRWFGYVLVVQFRVVNVFSFLTNYLLFSLFLNFICTHITNYPARTESDQPLPPIKKKEPTSILSAEKNFKFSF